MLKGSAGSPVFGLRLYEGPVEHVFFAVGLIVLPVDHEISASSSEAARDAFYAPFGEKIVEGFVVGEVYGVKQIGYSKVFSLWGWGGAASSDPHVSLPIEGAGVFSFGFHHFPQALLIGDVLLWAEC